MYGGQHWCVYWHKHTVEMESSLFGWSWYQTWLTLVIPSPSWLLNFAANGMSNCPVVIFFLLLVVNINSSEKMHPVTYTWMSTIGIFNLSIFQNKDTLPDHGVPILTPFYSHPFPSSYIPKDHPRFYHSSAYKGQLIYWVMEGNWRLQTKPMQLQEELATCIDCTRG